MLQLLENESDIQKFLQLVESWWVDSDGENICSKCWQSYLERFPDENQYSVLDKTTGATTRISPEQAQQPLEKTQELRVLNLRQEVLKSCVPLAKLFIENPEQFQASDGLYAQCYKNLTPNCDSEVFVPKVT